MLITQEGGNGYNKQCVDMGECCQHRKVVMATTSSVWIWVNVDNTGRL